MPPSSPLLNQRRRRTAIIFRDNVDYIVGFMTESVKLIFEKVEGEGGHFSEGIVREGEVRVLEGTTNLFLHNQTHSYIAHTRTTRNHAGGPKTTSCILKTSMKSGWRDCGCSCFG